MKDDDMWFSESAGEPFFGYSADDDELCLAFGCSPCVRIFQK